MVDVQRMLVEKAERRALLPEETEHNNEREFTEVRCHSRLVRHALRTGKVLYDKSNM